MGLCMANTTMEIRDDYDHESNPVGEPDINDVKTDLNELETLSCDLDKLTGSYHAVENFGISHTSVELLKITGLLSSTALSGVALESLLPESGDSVNSKIALEALSDTIKEKAAKWSAKLLSSAKKLGTIVSNVITPLWNKIKELASKAKEKISNNAAVQYVKTHPYETIFYSIAACTAIYTTMNFALQAYPSLGAPDSSFVAFNKALVNKLRMIKLPWGKIYTKVTMDGKVVMCEVIPAASTKLTQTGTVSKLGWTKAAIDTVISSGSKVFSFMGGVVKDIHNYYSGGIFLTGNFIKYLTKSRALATGVVGYMSWQYGKIVGILGVLLAAVVQRTFRMIKDVMTNLVSPETKPA